MRDLGELKKGDFVILNLARQSVDEASPIKLANQNAIDSEEPVALAQVIDPNGIETVAGEDKDLFPNMRVIKVRIVDTTRRSQYVVRDEPYNLIPEYSRRSLIFLDSQTPPASSFLAKVGLVIATEPNKPPQFRRMASR